MYTDKKRRGRPSLALGNSVEESDEEPQQNNTKRRAVPKKRIPKETRYEKTNH